MARLLPLSLALAISEHISEPGAMQQWPHHGDPHRRRARHRIKGEVSFAKAMPFLFQKDFLPCIPNVFARVFKNKSKRSRSEVEVHHESWPMASLSPLHALPKVASDWSAEAGTAPLFSQEPGTVEDFCYEKQYGTVDGRLPTAVGMHLNCRIPSTTSTIIESE